MKPARVLILCRAYTVYSETVLYDLLKRQINSGPVYAVLGNHDTYNECVSYLAFMLVVRTDEPVTQSAELAVRH